MALRFRLWRQLKGSRGSRLLRIRHLTGAMRQTCFGVHPGTAWGHRCRWTQRCRPSSRQPALWYRPSVREAKVSTVAPLGGTEKRLVLDRDGEAM